MRNTMMTTMLATACALGLAAAPALHADDDVRESATDARETLDEAGQVIADMRNDAELERILDRAEGVFVIPEFTRASFVIGGRGGEGVLLQKRDGNWVHPVFFDFGGVSAGWQAGAEHGEVAMILMTDEAVDGFMQESNWSLSADAGLTIVNWSAKAQASVGDADAIVWSDTEGLLGAAALGLTNVNYDEEETAAFYGTDVTRDELARGTIEEPAIVAELNVD